MRLLLCGLLFVAFSVQAQTRVKENIKQQAVAVSEDGALKPAVKPIKKKLK